jgi:uroporphyrinogen III methyltransferase / synthase
VTVYLVGAGPGDPGLLTVRGAELLQRADVVVHDRLTTKPILDLAPSRALLIDVGKRAHQASVPQEEINALLVRHGSAGEEVVRLKGGDPYVFGRGGEEAIALIAAGVPFEVVPGISSALAAPASAGIPLTLRDHSQCFTVVTGHEDPTGDTTVDWEALAAVGGPLVILMGVARLAEIAARLQRGGLAASTPVAAVHWATTERQTVTRATLGTVAHQDLRPPCTIVVGHVAALDLRSA